MHKIVLLFILFQAQNLLGQIATLPGTIGTPGGIFTITRPTITSSTEFSIGANENKTLNFTLGGSYNVGIGTYGTQESVLVANAPSSPSFNNNEGKLHIWHVSTPNYSQNSQFAPKSGGPQLLLDQRAIYSPGGPPADYYSRLQFRSTGVGFIGHTRYLQKGNVWEIKAKSYVYTYPFLADNPGYEVEDLIIRHSVGGDAITITGNTNTKHHGFTKLGNETNTPSIKMAYLTGTFANFAYTLIPHGIADPLKIVGVSVLLENSATNIIPPNYSVNAGLLYDYDINASNIVLTPQTGSLVNLQGKNVKVVITYVE